MEHQHKSIAELIKKDRARVVEYREDVARVQARLKVAQTRAKVKKAQAEQEAAYAAEQAALAQLETLRKRSAMARFWQLVWAAIARREDEERAAELRAQACAKRAAALETMARAPIKEDCENTIAGLVASIALLQAHISAMEQQKNIADAAAQSAASESDNKPAADDDDDGGTDGGGMGAGLNLTRQPAATSATADYEEHVAQHRAAKHAPAPVPVGMTAEHLADYNTWIAQQRVLNAKAKKEEEEEKARRAAGRDGLGRS